MPNHNHKPELTKEIREEILENLAALLDISPTVTFEALSQRSQIPINQLKLYVEFLKQEGYIEKVDELHLTQKGLDLGHKMLRKHRLLERLLHEKYGMKKSQVHDEACRLEHTLSDEAEAALCRYLKQPQNCPDDNRPIPICSMDVDSCDDCKSGKSNHSRISFIPLAKLEPGKCAQVKFIRGGRKSIRRLRDMGLVTNAKVTVMKRAPFKGPVEINVCSTKLAIGRKIAEKVFVEVC